MCTGLELFLIGAVVGTGAAVGTSAIVSAASDGSAPGPEAIPELPPLPEPDVIKSQAKEDARRRAALKSKTILTSGAGLIDEPDVHKKTLLGG